MARPSSSMPTEAELAILRVLWARGPSTVRDVHAALGASATVAAAPKRARDGTATRRGTSGYTTVLKILQIMTEKGLVVRDESQRTHVYRAARAQRDTQGALVRHLLDRAFGGAAHQLVLHALDAARSSPQELVEIRKLLDDAESRPQASPSPRSPPRTKGE